MAKTVVVRLEFTMPGFRAWTDYTLAVKKNAIDTFSTPDKFRGKFLREEFDYTNPWDYFQGVKEWILRDPDHFLF